MLEFQRNRSTKQYIYSYLTIFILGVIFIVLIKATVNIYDKERQSGADLALLTRKYEDLSQRSEYLKSEISRLSTENGVSEEIRDKFAVAKPDEKIVVIVDQDINVEGSGVSSAKQGFWQKFLNLFK